MCCCSSDVVFEVFIYVLIYKSLELIDGALSFHKCRLSGDTGLPACTEAFFVVLM